MSLQNIVVNVVLLSLVVVSMLSFSVSIGANYGQNSTTMTSDAVNIDTFSNNLNETNTQAFAWHDTFLNSIPLIGIGIVILQTLWNIGLLVSNTIMGTFNLFFTTMSAIFGVPPIVIGSLTTIAIFILMIAVYKFYRSGD
jgi:hypothetical protein